MKPEQIRHELEKNVERTLIVEARLRGLELQPKLFEQTTRNLSANTVELRQLFGERPPLALVGFDTPAIQEYVFKVRRPVDLFGGSRLVADFTDPEKPDGASLYPHLQGATAAVPPTATIYAGGGGGLLLVAASEAESVAQTLSGILARETHGDLRTITATLEIWPEDLSSEPLKPAVDCDVLGPSRPVSRYAATLATLTALKSRQRSKQTSLSEPIPRESHIDRCEVCGERTTRDHRPRAGEKELICKACRARWRYGCREKHDEDQPQDFKEMVDELPKTELAVIYADGANVGRAFQLVASMEQHRALSLAVDGAMKQAKDEALKASSWLAENDKRVQDPICGGDDLVLVLPALAAFEAVVPLIETFEGAFDLDQNPLLREAFADAPAEMRQRIGRFGLGVGIAVADFHFPIQFLLDYANQLLKSAKARLHGSDDEATRPRSAVDYLVLRSGVPLLHSIEKMRRRYLAQEPAGAKPGLRYTRRPFTAPEFTELHRRARLLGQHVPLSQIHLMRQEIRRGPELSRSLWRYQHARAKEGNGWAAYRAALDCELAEVDGLLWREEKDEASEWLSTDLLDMLDILGLVAASPPSPSEKGNAT